MARRKYIRRRSGKADGGSAWISYSDMMAALLLLFVLVLCYSVYQYFLMLETKTAELDQQSALLNNQQATLATQQTTLDEQQLLLYQQKSELEAQQLALQAKQTELEETRVQLNQQQALLAAEQQTTQEQQALIIASQDALTAKEAELDAARAELDIKQQELDNASILLGEQQAAMATQQKRLDDLVGVRTKIVVELKSALDQADMTAKVDPNTGDIVLESAVFFEVGKNEITPSGRAFLERFVPVYLSVMLQPEYADYIGEIIIEGHTDTQGGYLLNLELSQERALSVATFCLELPGLSEQEQQLLRSILTAKGRSYADPIYNLDGTVNMDASRRVEFKFRMKDSEMIDEIRNILGSEVE